MNCLLRTNLLFSVALFFAAVSDANAAKPERIEILKKEHRYTYSKIRQEEWAFTLRPVVQEEQVTLNLQCRLDAPKLAGSNPNIAVFVNGTRLRPVHLLNKRNEFTLKSGLDLTWYYPSYRRWRAVYAPDFEVAIKEREHKNSLPPDSKPYQYVWDITELAKAGKNVLRIQSYPSPVRGEQTLVFRDVHVAIGPFVQPPPPTEIAPPPTGPLSTFVASGPQRVSMRVGLRKSGDFTLTAAGSTFAVRTRTSRPDGKWLTAAQDAPQTTIASGASGEASWQTDRYSIQRVIEVKDDHVHVVDTIANTSRELLGLMIEHRLQHTDSPKSVLVAGRDAISQDEITSDSRSVVNGANPSVFGQWAKLGVGLVAEDDIFRVHLKSFSESKSLGLADRQLGIAPGDNVTLEWSIYPVPRGDYWEFVNAVRRNWGANFTIPGPMTGSRGFSGGRMQPEQKSAEWYRHWVTARGQRIFRGDIPTYPKNHPFARTVARHYSYYAHGTGILHVPQWVEFQRDMTQKLMAAAPDVKTLAYFHAQACTEPDAEKKYSDSRVRNPDGSPFFYTLKDPLPIYYGTRENSYGKAIWKAVETNLDEIGVSGLYWDEMSYCATPFTYDGPWDGCTVMIDPKTHAVRGKRSSIILLMQPLRSEIVRYLRDRGKMLIANSPPVTRTMLQQKIVRFVEAGVHIRLTATHFNTALGLGNWSRDRTQADVVREIRGFLRYGAMYYDRHTWQIKEPAPWKYRRKMFPITPVELREGMVLGQERIITARSGRFAWPDGGRANVYVVSAEGDRVKQPLVEEHQTGEKYSYDVRIPGDQFAILIRQDKDEEIDQPQQPASGQ